MSENRSQNRVTKIMKHMDFRARPNNDYLLNAKWQELYILTEHWAIGLSAAGGVLGIALGILGNFIIYRATKFYIPTSYLSIAVGFGFSALIGIAFGYFPARKAARLNPIEALRYE